MSRLWRLAFRVLYRILALIDPLVRAWWRRFGVGNTVELHVPRRDGRGTRSRLVGLLTVRDRTYVGHPNGHVGWTRDLQAAGEAVIRWRGESRRPVTATLLPEGAERIAAILATGQHPFPGNLVYRLGRRHVLRHGVYFRVEFEPADTGDTAVQT